MQNLAKQLALVLSSSSQSIGGSGADIEDHFFTTAKSSSRPPGSQKSAGSSGPQGQQDELMFMHQASNNSMNEPAYGMASGRLPSLQPGAPGFDAEQQAWLAAQQRQDAQRYGSGYLGASASGRLPSLPGSQSYSMGSGHQLRRPSSNALGTGNPAAVGSWGAASTKSGHLYGSSPVSGSNGIMMPQGTGTARHQMSGLGLNRTTSAAAQYMTQQGTALEVIFITRCWHMQP